MARKRTSELKSLVAAVVVAATVVGLILLWPHRLPAGYLESDYPGQTAPPAQPVQPAPQPEPVPTPRPIADNPTNRLIEMVELGEPIRWGGLTLFPLVAPKAEPATKIYSLATAVDHGWVTIEEDNPRSVSRAILVNKSDNLVLVLAGELVKGGQQNRSSQKDLLLGPDSRVAIDLYCVEHGRWAGEAKFDSARAIAPQSVRAGNIAGGSQAQVWADVKAFNEAAGAASPSESLLAGMDSDKVQRELADCRKAVLPKLPEGTVGLVAGRAGFGGGEPRVFAADLFVDKSLFDACKQMLLDSYAAEEIYHKLVSPPNRAPRIDLEGGKDQAQIIRPPVPRPPTREQAARFLAATVAADLTTMPTPGVGNLWRISGSATGQSLGYRGQAVHIALTSPRVTPVVDPQPVEPMPGPRPPHPPMPPYPRPHPPEPMPYE